MADHASDQFNDPLPSPGSDPAAKQNVLIVEDDEVFRMQLTRHVESLNCSATWTDNGVDALRLAREQPCDLVLLDVLIPRLDGRRVLQELKSSPGLRNIPVIVISGIDEEQVAASFIEWGAEDYLTKPFIEQITLRARIRASLEKKRLQDQQALHLKQLLILQQDLDRRNRELEERNAELRALSQKLETMALTDELTGLPNRRAAMGELYRLWAASDRNRLPLACLVVDVDHFKAVNDQFGHAAGDAVLQSLASRLRNAVRKNDLVCRLGGEEFIVLCDGSGLEQGKLCGERLRQAVFQSPFMWDGHVMPVTISVGVAARTDGMVTPEHLFQSADRAMYRAKSLGRNQVCLAD